MQQAGLCGKGQHEKNALTFRILPHQSEFLKHRSHHSTRLWRRWPDRQALGMKQGGKCTQLTSPWCGGGGQQGNRATGTDVLGTFWSGDWGAQARAELSLKKEG